MLRIDESVLKVEVGETSGEAQTRPLARAPPCALESLLASNLTAKQRNQSVLRRASSATYLSYQPPSSSTLFTMPIAPITGKLRKGLWVNLSVALGLGVTFGYAFWWVVIEFPCSPELNERVGTAFI